VELAEVKNISCHLKMWEYRLEQQLAKASEENLESLRRLEEKEHLSLYLMFVVSGNPTGVKTGCNPRFMGEPI